MTTKRKKIQLDMNGEELLMLMAEGNPGAISVLMKIMVQDLLLLLTMDDMNIRGPQVWVGYKDHCGQDLERFMECIRNRDMDMVSTINEQMMYPGSGFDQLAVDRGASWDHVS